MPIKRGRGQLRAVPPAPGELVEVDFEIQYDKQPLIEEGSSPPPINAAKFTASTGPARRTKLKNMCRVTTSKRSSAAPRSS
jgi:hypothetical protein